MATRRRNNEFRNKQNRALQAKRSENIEKARESQRRAFNRRKESNSDHIGELNWHLPKVKRVPSACTRSEQECTE